MHKNQSIIAELQFAATDPSISVSSLLRKAKIVASKLNLQDFLRWLDLELNGYTDMESDDIPKYRHLSGELKAFNPFHGWQPVLFEDSSTYEYYSSAPINQAIGPLEEMVDNHRKNNGSGSLVFGFSAEKKQRLTASLSLPMDAKLFLSISSVHGILDAVRNLLLDWILKLEAAGVTGEGMSFSDKEKDRAVPVTQTIFAQNIGFIGNAYDQATITSNQRADNALDAHKVAAVIDEIERSIHLIPAEKRAVIEGYVNEARQQMANPGDQRSQSKVKTLLTSIKTVCEGIAGNVVAQGIISLLGSLISKSN